MSQLRVAILSDLHLEFRGGCERQFLDSLPKPDGDVTHLICAGDLDCAKPRRHWGFLNGMDALCAMYPEVIYVPGNHDYYGGSPAKTDRLLKQIAAEHDNLTILGPKDYYLVGGRRIIGGTLWFQELPKTVRNDMKMTQLNDFYQISDFQPWVYEQNAALVKFFWEEMKEGDIVVTHHLPSARSTPREFLTSDLQPFFVCPLDDLILDKKPAVWIHGHTHRSCEYKLGETRVICNPVGYPGEIPRAKGTTEWPMFYSL